MTELYDDDELLRLTGFKRASDQAAWLAGRGIPHRKDCRRVIVSRVHVREWLEGRSVVVSEGPNWAALNTSRKTARAHA